MHNLTFVPFIAIKCEVWNFLDSLRICFAFINIISHFNYLKCSFSLYEIALMI